MSVGDRRLLLIDRGVAATEVVTIAQIEQSWRMPIDEVVHVEAATLEVVEQAASIACESMLAVGGGTTLDVAKLAAWAAQDTERMRRIASNAVDPYRILYEDNSRVPVFAAATTFGTGAESNAKASVWMGAHRLTMFAGRGLRPHRQTVLKSALQQLPDQVVSRGIAEILFRLLGPGLESTGPRRDSAIASRLWLLLGCVDAYETNAMPIGSKARADHLARLARMGSELHQRGMFDISTAYVGLPWFLGRAIQETAPTIHKVDAIVTMWLDLAEYLQVNDPQSEYLKRWEGIRTAYRRLGESENHLNNMAGAVLPESLATFLQIVSQRLHIDTDIPFKYYLNALTERSTASRWINLMEGNEDLRGYVANILERSE